MKKSILSKHLYQFLLNLLPMVVSLLIMQVFILPDLYSRSNSEYINFNYYLYSALLYIHVFNTVSFNDQAIRLKKLGTNFYSDYKFDLSYFTFFFVLYFFFCSFLFFIKEINLSIYLFLLFLYPIDVSVNILRLLERDKVIGALLLMQSLSFYVLFKLGYLDVFVSYTIANAVCFLTFLFFFKRNTFFFGRLQLSFKKMLSFFSMSIPTLNRYLDKIFILVFFSISFKTSLFPYLAVSGLVMLPITVASKVLIRSIDFNYPLRRFVLYTSIFTPVITIVFFTLNVLVVNKIYDLTSEVGFYFILAVSLFKTFNLIELLVFSLYSKNIEFVSVYSSCSKLVTFFMFTSLVFGYFFKPMMPNGYIFILCIYFFISLFLLLLSIKEE